MTSGGGGLEYRGAAENPHDWFKDAIADVAVNPDRYTANRLGELAEGLRTLREGGPEGYGVWDWFKSQQNRTGRLDLQDAPDSLLDGMTSVVDDVERGRQTLERYVATTAQEDRFYAMGLRGEELGAAVRSQLPMAAGRVTAETAAAGPLSAPTGTAPRSHPGNPFAPPTAVQRTAQYQQAQNQNQNQGRPMSR